MVGLVGRLGSAFGEFNPFDMKETFAKIIHSVGSIHTESHITMEHFPACGNIKAPDINVKFSGDGINDFI